MLIFLYGSLRDPVLLGQIAGDPRIGRRLRPARLEGHARVHIGGWNARYASVIRRPGSSVEGVVAQLTAPALPRLIAYEGVSYDLHRVRARVAGQYRMVGIWMARAVTGRPWSDPTDLTRIRMERSSTRHA